jgi:hypothetical protein
LPSNIDSLFPYTKFIDYIVEEIGEKQRGNVKKAIGKLSSPKI